MKSSLNTEGAISALPPATGSSNINVGMSERIVSALGGAALAVWGLRNLDSTAGVGLLLGGGYLLVRGFSGYCLISDLVGRNTAEVKKQASAMEVRTTFKINKSRPEVYAFWRKLENLPRFMQHLKEVKELDDKRSRWTVETPGKVGTVSWEAEIIEDISGEQISWSSLPGSMVDNAGEIKFRDTGTNSTEIDACISYRLPAGDIGSMAAKWFNPAVEKMIREDLRNFKKIMETGQSLTGETKEDSQKAGSKSYV